MSSSLKNWQLAAAKLKQIRPRCEALERGDQPKLTDEMRAEDLMELHHAAVEIVELCQAELNKDRRIEFCDSENYRFAKHYASLTAHVIAYLSLDTSPEMKQMCQMWIDNEKNLPSITINI